VVVVVVVMGNTDLTVLITYVKYVWRLLRSSLSINQSISQPSSIVSIM